MSTKIRLFSICCLLFPMLLLAQEPNLGKKPLPGVNSPASRVDTLGKDSLKVSINKTLKISKDALDAAVDYQAKDSIIFDNANNLVHLYGDASVKYQTIEVKAAYIVLNIKENLATAEGKKDSTGRMQGIPDFKDKDQTFHAQKMRYNFKNRKGVVYDVQTQQQSLYVLGEKSKFVSKKDSSDRDIIYSKDAILTTCSDPHPHFGIRAKKLKVITNKMVIVGPSNLEIGGVPTPVWLPFGFYPVTNTRHTGLLFPTTYGYQNNLGMGFRGLGWYFPINDHIDLKVTSTLYSLGTWGLGVQGNYNYRYKFSGGLNITYDNLANRVEVEKADKTGYYEKIIRQQPISISWDHRQDPKARPNQSFSANLHISTNASVLQKNVQNSVRDVSSNSNNSGINFSRQFPGKPYSISAGLTHSQNISTHAMNLTPNVNLQVNTLYPLKSLKRQGKDDLLNTVFEQFNIQTGASLKATMNTYDTLLFKKETIEKYFRSGLSYSASASVPLKLFKVITISPNVSFSQNVHFDQIKKTYNPKEVKALVTSTVDGVTTTEEQTIAYGKIDTVKTFNLSPVSTFSSGVSANTSLFATKQFKKGGFRGIRHKMDVNIGFNYTPYLEKSIWADSVQAPRKSLNDPITFQKYSIFEGSVLGAPSYSNFGIKNPSTKGSKTLNINTTHNVEIKVKGKKDSVARKIAILRSLSLGTNIDLNKDTLRMSSLTPYINQSILKGIVNLTLSTTLTPYVQGKSKYGTWGNTRRYVWDEKSLIGNTNSKIRIPKPVEFQSGTFTISSGASISQLRDLFKKKSAIPAVDTAKIKKTEQKPKNAPKEKTKDTYKSIWNLVDNFRLSHSLVMNINGNTSDNHDTLFVATNNLTLSGTIPLSPNWSLGFGNVGYDFKTSKPTYAGLSISRNLHCWDISGSWYPTRGTFLFTLRVINAPLDFLKYPIQKQNADAFGGYRF